jgi:hypothetical protein
MGTTGLVGRFACLVELVPNMSPTPNVSYAGQGADRTIPFVAIGLQMPGESRRILKEYSGASKGESPVRLSVRPYDHMKDCEVSSRPIFFMTCTRVSSI